MQHIEYKQFIKITWGGVIQCLNSAPAEFCYFIFFFSVFRIIIGRTESVFYAFGATFFC